MRDINEDMRMRLHRCGAKHERKQDDGRQDGGKRDGARHVAI